MIKGGHHSEETKRKMSEIRKHLWQDPAYRHKMKLAQTGKKMSPRSLKHRQKISERLKRQWCDPDYRRRRSSSYKKHKVGGNGEH